MLIIPWDLFSMKKLLKNEICGSVNSVRRKVKKLWLKREKKKKKNSNANMHLGSASQTHPKSSFGLSFLITQFSISITHNSKMVGLIAKNLFGK